MNDVFFKVNNVRLAQDFRDISMKWYIQINFDEKTGLTIPISLKQADIIKKMLDSELKKNIIEDRRTKVDYDFRKKEKIK